MITQVLACPVEARSSGSEIISLLPLVVGIMYAIRRAWQADRLQTDASSISWQMAYSAARSTVHRIVLRACIATSVAIALYTHQQAGLALLVGGFAIDSLLCLLHAYRVVARLDGSYVRLEQRRTWLRVDHLHLHCSRRAWQRASDLPTATLGK
jgi:hypothetical protein